ncbi:MAG TPA: recombinase family protein, partial [Candidatus Binatia bacterium]|nr:recombinase family protein [Candidatus Binatia bacterium]
MTTSELITPQHLTRKAIIYIRQSSPHQVLTNRESLQLQYALRERAVELGWHPEEIEIIDGDLGLSGTATHYREGFKELLARVTLGEVGIILSVEVQRLSRNCSDWYPLLDLCGYKHGLIADRDGVYDPGTPNGRLLLGLKGQLSEMELYTIRARMTAGLLNKAQRGDLALVLPVGLVRDADGVVRKEPNHEVQQRLEVVFATFLQRRSASKVLQLFNAQHLLLPRRTRFGDIVWKVPTVSAILTILKNPAYAGAFVYGRTRTLRTGAGPRQASQKKLPREQWRIRVNDKYPAYLSWQTYEQIQALLQDNYAEYDRNQTRGIPRPGAALLHGLVYCGACGHKMVVQYKSGTRYICNYLRQQYRVPVCQYLPADPVDAKVVDAFFAALSCVELEAYQHALAAQQQTEAAVARARTQQIQRLRYQAALAQRQFEHVDPANRLVAAELERRWETALRDLRRAEEEAQGRAQTRAIPEALPTELREVFTALGRKLPELWPPPVLSRVQKKALLRCLLEKVVVQRVGRDRVHIRMVWRGGEITVYEIPITVGSLAELALGQELEVRVLQLHATGKSDQEITQELTAAGFRSPMAQELLVSTVKGLRLKHRRFITHHQSHPRHVVGSLTVTQLAHRLGLSVHWLYDRI